MQASSVQLESNVRSYCRRTDDELATALGSFISTAQGSSYLDFLSGCGSLNYGHNDPDMKQALVDYIAGNGVTLSLDFHSSAKTAFMNAFNELILQPRKLNYVMQFTGPTGANAVEAAIKLARKKTGRTNVIAFTNGFHGCTLGALSLTANQHHRQSSEALLSGVTRMPYDGYHGANVDSADILESMLNDPSSGVSPPAAIVFECIQGEGGLNTASAEWAKKIERIARKHGSLIIVDEIQTGCGRSGSFFAFEQLGIKPDMVTLAKSLSGYGLPMAMVLLKPELDVWEPGEHNGTFRGNNHAFVTATVALKKFWSDDSFQKSIREQSEHVAIALNQLAERFDLTVKGKGMMVGLSFDNPADCADVIQQCYDAGLVVESTGPRDEVLKVMPPLTTSTAEIAQGLNIISDAVAAVFAGYELPLVSSQVV